jgi:hypothetical protein
MKKRKSPLQKAGATKAKTRLALSELPRKFQGVAFYAQEYT